MAEGNRFSGVSLEQAVIRHAQEDMKNLGPPAAAQPVAAAEPEGRKFGEGALLAMGRMGIKELAQALPAFPDSIRPVEEPGAVGQPHASDRLRPDGLRVSIRWCPPWAVSTTGRGTHTLGDVMPLLNLLGFGLPVILLMAGGLLASHVLKAQMAKLVAKPFVAAGIVAALGLAAFLFWPHKSWLSAGRAAVPAKTAHKPPLKKKAERPAKEPKTKQHPVAKTSTKQPVVRTPVAAMPGMAGPALGMGLLGGMGAMPLPGAAGPPAAPSAGGAGGAGGAGAAGGHNASSAQAAKQQQPAKGSASSQAGAKGGKGTAAPSAGLTANGAGQPKPGGKSNAGPSGAVASQQKAGTARPARAERRTAPTHRIMTPKR